MLSKAPITWGFNHYNKIKKPTIYKMLLMICFRVVQHNTLQVSTMKPCKNVLYLKMNLNIDQVKDNQLTCREMSLKFVSVFWRKINLMFLLPLQ